MPQYTVQDTTTGKQITFEWNDANPPTDSDMEEIFAQAKTMAPAKKPNGVTGEFETPKTATERMVNMAKNTPGDAVRTAKEIGGFLSHPIESLKNTGEAIGGAVYDATHMNDEQKEALKQKVIAGAKDPIGTINSVLDRVADYVEERPVSAGLMVATPGAPKAASGAVKAVTGAVKPTARAAEQGLEKTITKGIEKGIRPSVAGKGTSSMSQKYLRNAQDAVEHIVENKNNLRLTTESGDIVNGLPKNLKQFSEAIEQTKRGIFEQYNDLTMQAGKGSAAVDLNPISKELMKVAGDAKLKKFAPGIAQYAEKRAGEILTDGSTIGVIDAQDSIAIMNQSLESFYKNPTYENASKAYIDSLVVNNLRKSLDDVIEKEVGPGYAELKRSYGSLKTIEKDVTHRAIVDARKNVKGLIDFSDIFSSSAVVHGILSMNPSIVASGLTAKIISILYKIKNDPNRMISNMFSKTEKLIEKRKAIRSRKPTPSKTPPKQPPKSSPMPSDYNIEGTPVGNLGSGGLSLNKSSAPPPTTYGPLSDSYRKAGYSPATTTDEYIGNPSLPYNAPVYPQAGEPELLGDVGSIISALTRNKVRW